MGYKKRLLAFTLFAALAAIHAGALRAQWVPTNGLYGGSIRSFATNGTDLFVGTQGVGVFRSTNLGLSWLNTGQKVYNPFGSNGTNVFAMGYDNYVYEWSDDSEDWIKKGETLSLAYPYWFGTEGSNIFVETSNDIERSTDSGGTWVAISDDLEAYLSTPVAGFAKIDSFLFAGKASNGILRSSDKGLHWVSIDTLSNLYIVTLTASGHELFAGTDLGVMTSTDYGVSWKNISNGLPSSEVYSLSVLDSTIIAGTTYGLYVSHNTGISWQPVGNGLPDESVFSVFQMAGAFFVGTNSSGVFSSHDTGRAWTLASNGMRTMSATALLVQGHTLYASGQSLFRSNDSGAHWNTTMRYLSTGSSYKLSNITSLASIGSNIFAISLGVFLTTDSGRIWTVRSNGLPVYGIESLVARGSTLFVGTQGDGVFISIDSGMSWVHSINGLSENSEVASLFASGKDVIAGAGEGVFITSDDGKSWVSHNDDQIYSPVTAVAALDTTLFAGTIYGVFRSTIHDTTWSLVGPLGSSLSNSVNAFVVIDTSLFVGTQNGVFVSFNKGDYWIEKDSGLTYPDVLALTVYDSMLVAGTLSGGANNFPASTATVWRRPLSEMTTNPYALGIKETGGDSLFFGNIPIGADSLRAVTAFNAGKAPLTIQPIQAPGNDFETSDVSSPVLLNPGESFNFEVYFLPQKVGYHSAVLSLVSEAKKVTIVLSGTAYAEADVNNRPQSGSSLNINPNPISDFTTFSFTSQASGFADVSIVNLLGAEVAHLFSGELASGEHSFGWSKPLGLPDGMYECLVRMNGQVETLPVVVVR